MKAKLSIWSQYYYEMKIEDAVLEFIKNGIYASELSDEHGAELLSRSEDYIATGKALAAFLLEHNFEISQGHLWLNAKICIKNRMVSLIRRANKKSSPKTVTAHKDEGRRIGDRVLDFSELQALNFLLCNFSEKINFIT